MAEITTEADWLASVEPRALVRFAERRVKPTRFHHQLVRWGERVRGLLNARQEAAFVAYSAWANGGCVGVCPWPPEDDDFDFVPMIHWTNPAVNAAWFVTQLRYSQWLAALERLALAAAQHFPPPSAAPPLDATKAHRRKSKKGRAEQATAETDARERWRREQEAHSERTLWQFANEFRDIVGNPFRPVAFDAAWRTETVVGLAAGIDEAEAFERLPILADALQEAGCTDPQVLSHARDPGVHVRGCWLIDMILGRMHLAVEVKAD